MPPIYRVITLMMKYHMRCPIHIPNLRSHQPEPLLFIRGLQCDIILLDNHLPVRLPKLNGSPSTQLRQPFDVRQVDWRLILPIPAPALPVSPAVVLVPLFVAPGRGHGEDPLRFDDVVLADKVSEWVGGRFRRASRFAVAWDTHRLFY